MENVCTDVTIFGPQLTGMAKENDDPEGIFFKLKIVPCVTK